jgi:hypothetical protein
MEDGFEKSYCGVPCHVNNELSTPVMADMMIATNSSHQKFFQLRFHPKAMAAPTLYEVAAGMGFSIDMV